MHSVATIEEKLSQVFEPKQARLLSIVITEAYSELVKTSDFNELKGIVKELADAQKELTAAQKRTEDELRELVAEHRITRKELGGISTTVGYRLEDEAYKGLPGLLKKDHGLTVHGRLKRQYVRDNEGNQIEVNIFGEATKDRKKVTIIGEAKSQLSKNDVNEFIRKRLKRFEGVFREIFPVLVTYMISEPDVEALAKKRGIALYYSYDF